MGVDLPHATASVEVSSGSVSDMEPKIVLYDTRYNFQLL